MEQQNRDFKGVWIPKKVWLDERLSALDKIILMEIDSLDREDGCFATNEYLAVFCQCSERKISEAISNLIDFGYVYIKSFDGRNRVLRSRLEKSAGQSSKNCDSDSQKMRESNNILDTTTSSISIRGKYNKGKIPPTLEEVQEYCYERNNNIDPQAFIDFYESKGWMIGKNKMKDWKAAVRTWEKNSQSRTNSRNNDLRYANVNDLPSTPDDDIPW